MNNNKMMKVAIITGGGLPVPNVKGGAVEALVTMLGNENSEENLLEFTIFSVKDAEAIETIKREKNAHTHYVFINIPKIIRFFDICSYWIAKNLLHKHDLMSYKFFFQRIFFNHKVAKICMQNDYDRLIFENSLLPMRMLRRKGNSKYISRSFLHMHNIITHTFGMEKIVPKIAGVLTVSDYIAQKICESVPELDSSKVTVLRNCIDAKMFNMESKEVISKAEAFREKLNIPKQSIIFLFTGRLTEEKGAKQLLQAFKRINFNNAYLVIAGSYFFNSKIKSSFELELQALAKELQEHVKFTGFINYEDMPSVYAMSDVCVLPSIWDDPAPLAVIESIVSGTPLITTYSGGIPEYVNGKTAIILERNDDLVNELAKNMRLIAESTEVRKKMSREALKLGKQYNAKSYLANFVKCIK